MKKSIILSCICAAFLAFGSMSCQTHKRVMVISEYQGDDEPLGEWIKCASCDGSGACKKCKGTGNDGSCSSCKGTGVCSSCKGQGGRRAG